MRVGAVLRHELDARARGPCDLGATTGLDLDGVDDGTDRDVAQRQVVAGLDVRAGACLDSIALLELVWRDDVALLAVGEVKQRDASRAVGVVLDVRNLGRHAVFVCTLEVDEAVGALVATTLVTRGDLARVVATAGL